MQTRQIIELLKIRHAPDEWAHFVELAVRTGFDAQRMDFYAMNLYPSKKLRTIAYEIKVSRADFGREMKNPRKREPAEELACECFFVVPAGLVKPDEVPEKWGLLEVIKNGLRIKKHAQQKKIESYPASFMASLARRMSDPPGDLPEGLWLKSGKEITDDDIESAMRLRFKGAIREARAEAREYQRERSNLAHRNSLEMAEVVTKHLGFTMNAPSLDRWFSENGGNTKDFERRRKFMVGKMKRLREMLDNSIEELE